MVACKACYSIWVIISILLTLLLSPYIGLAQNPKDDSQPSKGTTKEKPNENQDDRNSHTAKVVQGTIVEVTEAIEEGENEDNLASSFIFSPSIAPATPQVLLVTPSSQVYPQSSEIKPSASSLNDVITSTDVPPAQPEKITELHDYKSEPIAEVIFKENIEISDEFVKSKQAAEKIMHNSDKKENIISSNTDEVPQVQNNGEKLVGEEFPNQNEINVIEKPLMTTATPTGTQTDMPINEKQEETVISSSNKLKDNKMLSFTEWKKKLDEGKEIESEEDIVNISKLVSQKNKTIPKKTSKITKNYASLECGAKVISANEGASNRIALLKEDKDVYMLNQCNVKAWFIVELCERIEIDSIDLANFEMFSSTPESFDVYVSSRYPTREWQHTGQFHGKPEKQVHNYPFEERFYAKFVKIEVTKYFGKDYYCPLSLLRVYGVTEVEQIEDEEENDNSNSGTTHHHDEIISESLKEKEEGSGTTNIFTTAKNAVVDLVSDMAKKITGKSIEEPDQSPKTLDIVSLLPDNITSSDFEDDFITRSIQRTTIAYFNSSVNPSFAMWFDYIFRRKMCATYNVTIYLANSFKNRTCDTRNIKDTIDTAFTGYLATPNNDHSDVLSDIPPIPIPPLAHSKPSQIEEELNPESFTNKYFDSSTSFVKESIQVDGTHKDIATTYDENIVSTCSTITTETVNVRNVLESTPLEQFHSSSASDVGVVTVPLEDTKSETINKITTLSDGSTTSTETVNLTESVLQPHQSVDVMEFKISKHVSGSMVAKKINAGNTDYTRDSIATNEKIVVQTYTAKSLTDQVVASDTETSVEKLTTSVAIQNSTTIQPTPSLEIVSPLSVESTEKSFDQAGMPNSKFVQPQDVKAPPQASEVKSDVLSEKQVPHVILPKKLDEQTTTASIVIESSESDSNLPSSTEYLKIEKDGSLASSSTTILKSTTGLSGSKESIIVKLNAKVKALQSNLTMSMMYLDEMSERYRSAVEEVDKRHELKAFALNVSLKVQQDLIAHQASLIRNLTLQVQELTKQMQNLTEATQEHYTKLTESHYSWMFIEFMSVVIVILLCCRRTLPKKQSEEQNRRTSEPVIGTPRINGNLKRTKSISDANLHEANRINHQNTTQNGHTYEISATSGPTKKKRRRKSKNLMEKYSSISPAKDMVVSNKAGLLFSAGNRFISGITGAFYNTSNVNKPSRQADALIDDNVIVSKKAFNKSLIRTRSTDLSTIEEIGPKQPNGRPNSAETMRSKSMDDSSYSMTCQATHKKHQNKIHKPIDGRFS